MSARGTATSPNGSIPRVHKPSRSTFQRDFVLKARPAILTGVLDEWPALGKWTPQFFAETLGDMVVPGNQQNPGDEILLGQIGNFVKMPMRELMDLVVNPPDGNVYYLRAFPIYKAPVLMQDYEIPDICPNWIDLRNAPFNASREAISKTLEETLFVGGAGVVTPLHTDGVRTGAILAQLYGRKRCVLFPGSQSKYLYPRPLQKHFGMSAVDFRKPDLERFPLYRNAKPLEFVLEPGELLYIPHGCWHGVESLDPSVSYSIQILNRANFLPFVVGLAERPIAAAYYASQGGFKKVIGAVAWE